MKFGFDKYKTLHIDGKNYVAKLHDWWQGQYIKMRSVNFWNTLFQVCWKPTVICIDGRKGLMDIKKLYHEHIHWKNSISKKNIIRNYTELSAWLIIIVGTALNLENNIIHFKLLGLLRNNNWVGSSCTADISNNLTREKPLCCDRTPNYQLQKLRIAWL